MNEGIGKNITNISVPPEEDPEPPQGGEGPNILFIISVPIVLLLLGSCLVGFGFVSGANWQCNKLGEAWESDHFTWLGFECKEKGYGAALQARNDALNLHKMQEYNATLKTKEVRLNYNLSPPNFEQDIKTIKEPLP